MKKIVAFLLIFCVSFAAFGQVGPSSDVIFLNNDETVEVPVGVPVIFTNKDAPKEEFMPMIFFTATSNFDFLLKRKDHIGRSICQNWSNGSRTQYLTQCAGAHVFIIFS